MTELQELIEQSLDAWARAEYRMPYRQVINSNYRGVEAEFKKLEELIRFAYHLGAKTPKPNPVRKL